MATPSLSPLEYHRRRAAVKSISALRFVLFMLSPFVLLNYTRLQSVVNSYIMRRSDRSNHANISQRRSHREQTENQQNLPLNARAKGPYLAAADARGG